MTINQQPKAVMDAAKSLPDSAVPTRPSGIDSEVVPRARRRRFSNADKRRILQAADRCTQPGEIGALMRREGVYSSSLSNWRRQREAADLAPRRTLIGPRRCTSRRSRANVTASRTSSTRRNWSSKSKKKLPLCWGC